MPSGVVLKRAWSVSRTHIDGVRINFIEAQNLPILLVEQGVLNSDGGVGALLVGVVGGE